MDKNLIGIYIVSTFLILNLLLGLWAGRGVKDITDYAIGNKKWGIGAVVMSTIATSIGGNFILLSPKEIYSDGLIACIPLLGIPISYIIRAIFYTRTYEKFKKCTSLPEIIMACYGNNAKIVSAAVSTIFALFMCSLQIKILSLVFSDFMHSDPMLSVILSGSVIVLYTAFGGMRAVIATDIFQFIMMFGVFLALAIFAVNQSGGADALVRAVKVNIQNNNIHSIWPYLSIFFIDTIFLQESAAEAPKIERFQMAQTEQSLKKILYLAALGTFIGAIIVVILSFSIFNINPSIPEGTNPITWYYANIVPSNYQHFVIIGLIAIVLSSGDSWLHSAGNSLSRDLLPSFSKYLSLTYTKLSVLVLGTLSIYIALYGESLIYNLRYLLSLASPILCVPLLVAFMGLKTSPRMFFSSAIFSIISFIYITFFTQNEQMGLFLSTCIGLIAILATHLIEYSTFTFENSANFEKDSPK